MRAPVAIATKFHVIPNDAICQEATCAAIATNLLHGLRPLELLGRISGGVILDFCTAPNLRRSFERQESRMG